MSDERTSRTLKTLLFTGLAVAVLLVVIIVIIPPTAKHESSAVALREEPASVPTATPTPTGTVEPTPSPTQEPTPQPSEAPTAVPTATPPPTATPVPAKSPVPVNSPTPTEPTAPKPTATAAPQPQPAASPRPVEVKEVATAAPAPPVDVEAISEAIRSFEDNLAERAREAAEAAAEMKARMARAEEEKAKKAALMAQSLESLEEAWQRTEESIRDEQVIQSLAETAEPNADVREASDLADQEVVQRQREAELHQDEFEAMRAAFESGPAPASEFEGKSTVGSTTVMHRAKAPLSAAESQRIMASKDGSAMRIKAVFHRGDVVDARRMWVSMGAAYALIDFNHAERPLFQVQGDLDAAAKLVRWDPFDFFREWTTRYHPISTREGSAELRAAAEKLRSRVLEQCSECTEHQLVLVYSWQLFGVILADAEVVAKAHGVDFPGAVSEIAWVATREGDAVVIRVISLESKGVSYEIE